MWKLRFESRPGAQGKTERPLSRSLAVICWLWRMALATSVSSGVFTMTTQLLPATAAGQYRTAGKAAIISGVIGILAFGSMAAAVFVRLSGHPPDLLFTINHVGVILQSLLMIPVALALGRLSRQRPPAMSRATLAFGIVALSLTVFWLALIFIQLAWDAVYTVPQGLVGVWLMLVNWRLSGVLGRAVRWLGTIAGFGMVLVGQFPITYAIFVEPVNFFAPSPDDASFVETTANSIIHLLLIIGSYFGVLPYPIWSMLVGRRLLRERAA